MRARLLRSGETNPHRNLAREEALLMQYGPEGPKEAILYLWQNASTVVIGRNQNAWRECRTQLLEQEGGTLARRTTGGGAVFHDLGNLNFSFLMPRDAYDLSRQLSVVQEAVRSFGIECEFSGRNDLLAQGRKFSGNAFRLTRHGGLHHGTLLIDVDHARMARYLQVSPEKMSARGVKSVASRVVNLKALCGDMTVEAMALAMQAAFRKEYGPCEQENADALALDGFEALAARNASWDWNYGAAPSFDISLEKRFAWGGVELLLSLSDGRVSRAKVYTDAMDEGLSVRLEEALTGCPFRADLLADQAGGDVGEWLRSLEL